MKNDHCQSIKLVKIIHLTSLGKACQAGQDDVTFVEIIQERHRSQALFMILFIY